jgi:hypothetical protein
MAYKTFRVEITRDETRDSGPVIIEITAYIDRTPETNEATVGVAVTASGWVERERNPSSFAGLDDFIAGSASPIDRIGTEAHPVAKRGIRPVLQAGRCGHASRD